MDCIYCGSKRQVHLSDHYTNSEVHLAKRHIMYDENDLVSMEFECKDCGKTYNLLNKPKNINKELLENILDKFRRERLECKKLEDK